MTSNVEVVVSTESTESPSLRNRRSFIHQSTSESLFIELKGEIKASNL